MPQNPNRSGIARRRQRFQHLPLRRAAVIPEGFAPGSDVGNMSILGYDPAVFHTGRAPIEAAVFELDAGGVFAVGDEANLDLGLEAGVVLPVGADVP